MTSAGGNSVIATRALDSGDTDVSMWRGRGWALSSHLSPVLLVPLRPTRDLLCSGRRTSSLQGAELSHGLAPHGSFSS